MKITISTILDVWNSLGIGKYFEITSMIGKIKNPIFDNIIDIIWNKITSWSKKIFSQVGREVLLKYVVQTILSYCTSVFLLPNSIEDDI